MPVGFVTGFLGAGKTTLINALLKDPGMAGTVVAVNEFGAVALDQHLIAGAQEDVLVLANGCLCCNLSGDAEATILRLFARRDAGDVPQFRRLLIEPSGLADPAPLMQAILRNPLMARYMRLAGIVGLVDVPFGLDHIAKQPEARQQVAMADRILLTKSDLAPAEALVALQGQIAGLNPLAPQHLGSRGRIDVESLFPPHFLDPALPSEADLPRDWGAGTGSRHSPETEALVLTHVGWIAWPPLEAWLREIRLKHAEALLRIKGLVALDGAPGPLLIQGVHHVLHPPVQLEHWPDDDHSTRLILILRGVDPGPIRARWATLTEAAAPF